jgi:hypothetical protein
MHVKRIMASPEPKNMLVSTSGNPQSVASAMATGDSEDHNNHELTTQEVPIVVALGNFTALVSDRVAILEKLFIDGSKTNDPWLSSTIVSHNTEIQRVQKARPG